MNLKSHRKTTTLAAAGAGLLAGTLQTASAADDNAALIQQMQQQIQQLQQQVKQLQTDQQTLPADQIEIDQSVASATEGQPAEEAAEQTTPKQASSGPTKKLNIGAGVRANYQLRNGDADPNRRDGGDLIFNHFLLNAAGEYGKLTYAAEQRFSETNFADSSFLHYGWAAYDFGSEKHHQVKGGYFQVPFGNYPFGYQNFWGSMAYYTGFTDAQAAGIGYKYENGPFRLDIDAYKNDDLEQNSTYGSNPFQGYQRVNGGSVRTAYTFNHGNDNTLNVSASVRGGELEVGEAGVDRGVTSDYGNHWAASLAADARLGLWTLQGQFVDYKYNIPNSRTFGGNALPTDAITVENYGFAYQVPASGQMYGVNIARDFPVEQGPISNYQLYMNYGYLDVGGDGSFTGDVPGTSTNYGQTGDIQHNVIGASMAAGPLYIYADAILGKNDALGFNGPNDGDWQARFNLALTLYFSGDVIK